MLSIKQEWQKYRFCCVPDSASPNQLEETEKAFYAGCGMLLEQLIEIADKPETEAIRVMKSIKQEISTWMENYLEKYKSPH